MDICNNCGIEANRLTCLKKYGQEPLKAKFDISTYHCGMCDVCGKEAGVTQERDFFYPDFSLLKKIMKQKEAKSKLKHIIIDLEELEGERLQGDAIENIGEAKRLLEEILLFSDL